MSTTTTATNTDAAKKRRKPRAESPATFHITLFDKANRIQTERTGLISNEKALRLACWESYTSSVDTIIHSLDHMSLFGGEDANEELSKMVAYASEAAADEDGNIDLKTTQVLQKLSEKFAPAENNQESYIRGKNIEEEKKEREEIMAP